MDIPHHEAVGVAAALSAKRGVLPRDIPASDIRQTLVERGIGTKIKCFDGQGAIPAVSVLADFAVPYTASKGFNVDHLAPSLYLLFDNPVNDWLSIGYNLGAEWDGALPNATTFAAVCLGFTATEKLGCFVESYNYFGELGNIYAMDFGLNWMVGRKVQLDLAANMDLRTWTCETLLNAGLSAAEWLGRLINNRE